MYTFLQISEYIFSGNYKVASQKSRHGVLSLSLLKTNWNINYDSWRLWLPATILDTILYVLNLNRLRGNVVAGV